MIERDAFCTKSDSIATHVCLTEFNVRLWVRRASVCALAAGLPTPSCCDREVSPNPVVTMLTENPCRNSKVSNSLATSSIIEFAGDQGKH